METDRKIAASLPPAPPSVPPSNGSNNSFPRVRPMHGRTTGPTRRSTRGQWTPEEDEILYKAVQHHKGKNWKKIAECFKDRTDVQCLHRWQKVLNPELIKGPWSKEENEMIVQLVDKYGPKKWSTIAQHLPGRIGKQCRERWHNHLNPAINKEAWTQEEELILIRAHQVHGNRWAELTKYLPGRTDNSVKNHWNSSVKKKLDSYIASGLLAQFQGLPVVNHQNQFIPVASLRLHHNSGDGSVCRGGENAEANSECSQVGCSQTASDMSNTACQTREELLLSEESDHGKVQVTSTTGSYSELYYTSLDDVTFTISDIPCEFTCSPEYLDENISKDPGNYANKDRNFGEIDLLNISSGLDSSNLPGTYFSADTNPDRVLDPNYQSDPNLLAMEFESSGKKVKAEEGCSRVILPEEEGAGHPSSANLTKCSDIIDMDRYRDILDFQSSFQVSEAGETVAMQPYNPWEASQCQNLSSIPCEVSEANCSKTLCYEPPRFPSLDIPFLSCDLAQSGNDVQQEFSPLGIRQLMMSSMSNLTPFKLWDSPSSDDNTPDAVLKSAARTFACTPSILKKRHRDLLSPLSPFSERRPDKKTGRAVVNQGFLCTSRLTKDFSRLDVMFNEADENTEALIEDKENICPASQNQTEEAHNNHDSGDKTSEEANKNNIKEREGILDHDSTISVYEDRASETPRGILVVCHLNDTQFSSPDGARPKVGGLKSSYGASEVHQCSNNASEKFATSDSGIDKAGHVVSPSSLSQKKESNNSVVSSSQTTCAVSSVMVDNLVNEVGAENLNIFGGTPFRRSIEPPSAWKSPWYFSSMIEDIGFFMSPGEIDALGLMKQINEHSADAYADAWEVLGSDTPESILRQRCLRNQDPGGETKNIGDSLHEGHLRLASNVSTEPRVLDFSECGSPEKSTEKKKCISATSLTSPSLFAEKLQVAM